MLARWIATVAALLLACAQASAHVRAERAADLGTFAAHTEHALEIERSAANASSGELASNPKTAPPARASLENSASGENAALTHCHAWENWAPLKKCASGVDKYLYANGNPGSYIDPSGNCAEPVTAVICALGLATVATAAVEYARLSWFGDEEVRENAGSYAVQNTANALGVVGLTALALETGGATAPLVMGFARGGVSGLTSAYLSNAPRVYTAAENLAYAGAGMAGADMPSMTPQLPVGGALPKILSAAGEIDDLAVAGVKFADEVPAAPTLSPSMSSAQLDEALDGLQPKIGAPQMAQITEGGDGALGLTFADAKVFTSRVSFSPSTGRDYTVFQRNDIDWSLTRTAGSKEALGLSNLEAAALGHRPQLTVGTKPEFATLHHSQQSAQGPWFEASTRYHNIRNAKAAPLHPYEGSQHPFYPLGSGPGSRRAEFQSIESPEYWQWRAKQEKAKKSD